MNRVFLYIDILGFEHLVKTNPSKIDQIFEIFDSLKVFKHYALQTVVFSDTILVFNKNISHSDDYYCTYLVEYAQELFYKLSWINIYYKGILTFGEFSFTQMSNIQAYYGLALVNAYKAEKRIQGFGLFVDKKLSKEIVVFDSVSFNDNYNFIILCQSLNNLYSTTKGKLPIEENLLYETDDFHRIDEDLRFMREIEYLKNYHPTKRIRNKYKKVYLTYKKIMPKFFKKFESEGFLPFILNSSYLGNFDPFVILSENELKQNP